MWVEQKRENMFIKDNIAGNIHTVRWNMKTFIPFVNRTIPKEDTLLGAKSKFMCIIWTKVGPASTTKHT